MVTLIALGAATGCGTVSESAGKAASTTGEVMFGWATPTGVPSPVEVLDRAGITLPEAAEFTGTATQYLDERTVAYLYVFRVDPHSAYGLCDQGGLGGARKVAAVPPHVKASMGEVLLTDESRWCEGAAPKDASLMRYILIDQGSPATVHLSIQQHSR